jgi:5-methylcytosine-specific restriction endonuclease McrA
MKIPRGQTAERRAYMKAWYEANKEYNVQRSKKYRDDNKETIRKRDAAYRAANAEKLKARSAAYYQANRERILAQVREYTEKNKEKVLDYHADHYLKNTERIKSNVAQYRKKYPEKKAHLENKRRARKFGNGGSHTLEELTEKFAELGNACYYCGCDGKLTIDHDIPLARGGSDNIENILPACRPCNSRKKARTTQEFLEYLERRKSRNMSAGEER